MNNDTQPTGVLHSSVSRRSLLRMGSFGVAAIGLSGVLSACSGGAAAVSSGPKASGALKAVTTVNMSSSKIDNYLMDEVLKSQKIFDSYNIAVPEFLYPSSGVQGMQLVVAGSTDLCQQDTLLTLATYANSQAGSHPLIVGMRIPETTYSIVVGPGDWPGESASFEEWMGSLKGKTIGVTAIGAGADTQLKLALGAANMAYEDVTALAVGLPPAAIAQMKAGKIDAYVGITWATSRFLAEQAGGSILFDFAADAAPDLLKKQEVQPLVGNETFIKDNPDVVKAYLAANEDAKTWIIDNQDAATKIVNTNFLGGQSDKVAADYIDHFVNVVVPKIEPSFKVRKEPIDLLISIAEKAGALNNVAVTYEDVVADFARV